MYTISRDPATLKVHLYFDDKEIQPFNGGFEYGYRGTGCKNTALAILQHYLNETNLPAHVRAWDCLLSDKLAPVYKEDVISGIPRSQFIWKVEVDLIHEWVQGRITEPIQKYMWWRTQFVADVTTLYHMELQFDGMEGAAVDSESEDRWRQANESVSNFEIWFAQLTQRIWKDPQ